MQSSSRVHEPSREAIYSPECIEVVEIAKQLCLSVNLHLNQSITMNVSPIISSIELHQLLKSENTILLDATIPPVGSVNALLSEFIPGSIKFDFDHEICDQLSDLPHMLPAPEQFAEKVAALGVSNSSKIIVYDRIGMFAAPRAWWMFRVMGHKQVQVLDGGLPAWKSAGFEVIHHLCLPNAPGNFSPSFQPQLLVRWDDVVKALKNDDVRVMDARSSGRFAGREQEPRPGLRCGHMPGALNIPFQQVLNEGRMKSVDELMNVFDMHKDRRMIFSCGSGVTACILALAAEMAGFSDWAVYDGSWAEWGREGSSFPVISDVANISC